MAYETHFRAGTHLTAPPAFSGPRTARCGGGSAGRHPIRSMPERHDHSVYGSWVRGAWGACTSSDCRYWTQPRMNSGHAGTSGTGSVVSGSSPHRAGWCQHRAWRLLSRWARIPCRSFLTSVSSSSRVIWSRSVSIVSLSHHIVRITSLPTAARQAGLAASARAALPLPVSAYAGPEDATTCRDTSARTMLDDTSCAGPSPRKVMSASSESHSS